MASPIVTFLLSLIVSFVLSKEHETAMEAIMSVNSAIPEDKATFSNMNEPVTFEGDIGFNQRTAHLLQQQNELAMGIGSAYGAANRWGIWHRGVVPYVIDNSLRRGFYTAVCSARSLGLRMKTILLLYVPRAMSAIRSAIEAYHKLGCITLKPRDGERDYVWMNLNTRRGCWSWIGRQGGGQELSLSWGCHQTGTTIHEIMHAIGFFHEQARLDRDNYVNIHWNNIPQNQKYNFQKYRNGQATTHGFGYDKRSIMHYHRYEFAANRRYPSITSKKDYNEKLGGTTLTTTDIAQISRQYGCRSYDAPLNPFPQMDECKDKLPSFMCKVAVALKKCHLETAMKKCAKTCGKCEEE